MLANVVRDNIRHWGDADGVRAARVCEREPAAPSFNCLAHLLLRITNVTRLDIHQLDAVNPNLVIPSFIAIHAKRILQNVSSQLRGLDSYVADIVAAKLVVVTSIAR